ncbi:MAG TPA: UvrB/UvrC motif-containing protein [Phycisphaerales bacterium]
MKCDRCDNDATVHEVTVRNGVKVEKHLCEACAAGEGIAGATLGELLTKFMTQESEATAKPKQAARVRPSACPGCGFTFEQFRQAGLLGCPACYKSFEALLTPLIERAHEGSTQHTGKVPKRIAARAAGREEDAIATEDALARAQLRERQERLKVLQRQLDEAVRGEQYELAARLRDQIRKVDVTLVAKPRDARERS